MLHGAAEFTRKAQEIAGNPRNTMQHGKFVPATADFKKISHYQRDYW